MKNYLKVLVALILAVVCIFAYASCDILPGTNPDSGNQPGEQPGADEFEESYQIKLVYSYVYQEGTRTRKENVTVNTISVPVDNTGWTSELISQVKSTMYNGYSFVDWYTEWNENGECGVGDAYAFPTTPITGNITLYGYRGSNVAGPNATWALTEEGKDVILTISGSGDMFDFSNGNAIDVPWYENNQAEGGVKFYYNTVTKIVIEEGITSVGSNAFNGFTAVNSLELASTITKIGANAFSGVAIKTLNTPTSLKTISDNAFANCLSLREVVLNDGLETIGIAAFNTSYKIKTIVVPASLKSIGNAAFHPGLKGSGSSDTNAHQLSKVYYLGTESQFAQIDIAMDNVWFNELASVYYYYEAPAEEDVRGPYWSYAKTPEGEVTDNPLQYCYSLKYYLESGAKTPIWVDYVPVIPQVDENGDYVLDADGLFVLNGVVDEENVNFRVNKKYHGYEFVSFGANSDLEVGMIINDDKSFTCTRYTSKTGSGASFVGGGILSEDGGIVWSYSSGTLTISKDPNVEVKEGRTPFRIFDFESNNDTGTLWLNSLTALANVRNLVIEDGVEYIGRYTFASLISLESVTIPASVKQIDITAFDACSSLVAIYYDGENLADCVLTDSTNPNAAPKTLADANVLTHTPAVYYARTNTPVSVAGNYWTDINGGRVAWVLSEVYGDDNTFAGYDIAIGGDKNLPSFGIPEQAPWYAAKDSIISASFAKNVISIGENVLFGYSNLNNLSLPVDLRKIPESAFSGTGIVNDMSKYTNGILVINNFLIKVSPFLKNESLVEVPYRVVSIAGGAFARCTNTTQIYIPATVQYINEGAFVDSGLKYIFTEGTPASWESVAKDANLSESVAVLFKTGSVDSSVVSWTKQDGNYIIVGCLHTWSDWYVDTEPTHSKMGVEKRVCLYDDEHFEVRDIPKITDCLFETYTIHVPATCTDDAIEISYCEIAGCNRTHERVVEGTRLGGEHVFINYVDDNNLTCHSYATKTAVCENPENPGCCATDSIEVVSELLPHDFSIVVAESGATCQSHFNLTSRCSNDGCTAEQDLGKVENANITAHAWVDVVAPQYLARRASLYAPAIYYKSCEYCGVCCKDSVNTNDNDGDRLATFAAKGTELKYYDWNYDELKVDAVNGPINAKSADMALNTLGTTGVYSMLVYEAANKVLAIGKNSGDWATINIANTQKEAQTKDTVHVFETMFRVGEFNNSKAVDYIFQFNFATAPNSANEYFLRTMFYDMGDNIEIRLFDAKATVGHLNFDEWYSIRIEYYTANNSYKALVDENGEEVLDENGNKIMVPDEENPTKTVKFYINGELMYSNDKFVPVYSSKATVLSDENLDSIYFEPRGGLTSGVFYLDDTYVATVDRSFWDTTANYVPTPVEPEAPAEPETPAAPEYDFEKSEAESNKGVVTNPADGIVTVVKDPAASGGIFKYIQSSITVDPKDAANKVLWVSTNANTAENRLSSYTEFNIGEAVGNGYVFTAKMLVADGMGVIENIWFTDENGMNISFALNLEVYEVSGTKYVRLVEEYAGLDGIVDTIVSGIALNEWFELSIELFKTPVLDGKKTVYVGAANIYLNGEYAGYSDSVVNDANGKMVNTPIEKVIFYHNRFSTTSIYFDDVTVGSIDKEFVPTIKYVGFSPVQYGQVSDRTESNDTLDNTVTFEDGAVGNIVFTENGKNTTSFDGTKVFSFYETTVGTKVNKVIKVVVANEANADYAYATITPSEAYENGLYKFSADVYWENPIAKKDGTGTMLSQFVIRANYNGEIVYTQLVDVLAVYDAKSSSHTLAIRLNNTNEKFEGGTGTVMLVSGVKDVFNKWVNFGIEMNKFGKFTTIAFYIDGECVVEPTVAYNSTVATLSGEVCDIIWRFNKAAASVTYIDNVVFDCEKGAEKPSIRPEESINDSDENAITFEDGMPSNVTFNVNGSNITEFTSGKVFSFYETNVYDATGAVLKTNKVIKAVATENETSYALINFVPVNATGAGVYTFSSDVYYANPTVPVGEKIMLTEITVETNVSPARLQLIRFYLENIDGVLNLVIQPCNDGKAEDGTLVGTGVQNYEMVTVPNVVDNWFNLKIVINKAGEGTNVSIYVNDECVVEPTISYFHPNGASANAKVTSLSWRQRKDTGAVAYIDNVVFSCEPTSIGSDFDDGVSLDFANGEYGDYNVTYNQGEGITDGYAKVVYDYDVSNGYLAMVKKAVSEGNVQSYFNINYKDTDGNILVYETPVRMLDNNGEIISLQFMTVDGNIVDGAFIKVDTTDNTVMISLNYDEFTDTGVAADSWFTLRYAYYPNGTSYTAALSVNGNSITREVTPEAVVSLSDVASLRIIGSDAWIGEFDIDYLKLTTELYVPTKTETVTNSIKYDFEVDNLASYGGEIYNGTNVALDTTYENASKGYATIVTDSSNGNKYLEFGKNSENGAVSLVLNADIGGGVGPYTVSFDFMMIYTKIGARTDGKSKYTEWPLRIRMGNSDNNSWTNIFAQGRTNSQSTEYYFKTNSGNDSNKYFAANTWVTLKFTYDPVSENCELKMVLADGTESVLMKNKMPYYKGTPAFEDNDAVLDCILLETRGSTYFTDVRYAIDNVEVNMCQTRTTERGNGKYASVAEGYESYKDASEVNSLRSNMENFFGGSYNANLTEDNSWANILSSLEIAGNNNYLNLGKQSSSSGGANLSYTATPETKTGDKYVFETDIMIAGCVDDFTKSQTGNNRWHFNIYFQSSTISATSSNYLFHMYATMTKDGKIALYDGSTNRVITVIEFNAWYNLRIEYTPGAMTDTTDGNGVITKRTITGKTEYYVNNAYAGYYNSSKDYSDPDANALPTNADFKQVTLQLRGYSKYIEVNLDNTYVNAVSNEAN